MLLLLKKFKNYMAAKRLSSHSKRLDLASAQIANLLHLGGFAGKYPIRNKVCLEIGSGWVLSHALVFYLLGAKKVIATDIDRVAHPPYLYNSIHSSEISVIRDILAPFEDHNIIRERLDNLSRLKFSFDTLEDLGIEYIAPIDLASDGLSSAVDIEYSNAVLEHIPREDAVALLNNISKQLSSGGMMLNSIHLEDHKDIGSNPFGFYAEPPTTREAQLAHGNMIRKSEWISIISQIAQLDYKILYEFKRVDKPLPELHPSVAKFGEDDLNTSHIGILCTKHK